MTWSCSGTIFRLFHSTAAAAAAAAVKATVARLRLLYLSYLPHYRNVWHNCAIPPPDPIPTVCHISASYRVLAFPCPFTTLWTALVITAAQTEGRGEETSVEGKNHCGWIQIGISSHSLWDTVTLQSFLYSFVSNKCDGVIKMRCLLPTGQVWHEQQNKIWKVRKMTFFCTSVWKRLGSSSTMPGKLHVQSHIYVACHCLPGPSVNLPSVQVYCCGGLLCSPPLRADNRGLSKPRNILNGGQDSTIPPGANNQISWCLVWWKRMQQ